MRPSPLRLGSYLGSASWLMAERVIGLGLAFVVTLVLARYLGPEGYGVLSYALSLAGLAAVTGHLGLHGLAVRELARDPAQAGSILGTLVRLKAVATCVGFIALLAVSAWLDGAGSLVFWAVFWVGVAMITRAAEPLEYWFHARPNMGPPVLARLTAQGLGALAKLTAVAAGAGVLVIAGLHALQGILAALLLALAFGRLAPLDWRTLRFDGTRARELLRDGALVFAGSVFAMIYLKIDQVMLRTMIGLEAVGTYGVAAVLSEGWYFLPVALVAAIFPRLIALRDEAPARYRQRFQQLLDLLFVIALAVALAVTFLAEFLVQLIFGIAYIEAAPVLAIHVWAGVFVFMRAAFSRWILIENLLVLSLITQGLGAVANVLLNFWLVPRLGIVGAAWATLISYGLAAYLSLAVHPRSRPFFVMMTAAMLAPLRYAALAVSARMASRS